LEQERPEMSPPQESRSAKISALAAVAAVVVGYLTWQYPKQSRSDQAEPPAAVEIHQGPDVDSPASGAGNGTPTPSTPENDGKPKGDDLQVSRGPGSSTPACGTPEIATLGPGEPARVASGLAVLSAKAAREGSEPYVTLGIASDRDTLAEAVLGAPVRYRFTTSRGAYFVNVMDVDLTAGTMTVQVGCETKETTP
jgi:hypothetical protein